MVRARAVLAALAVGGVLAAGCSSGSPAAGPSTTTSSRPGTTAASPASVDALQAYLDQVNRLCDALLPKVVAVTHGGSLDIPLSQYFAQQPAHQRLLADFDRQLAGVPVPAAATSAANAMGAYIRFADELDARRLTAANKGAAAYAAEIRREQATAADDPSITARNAAGFADSCDAR